MSETVLRTIERTVKNAERTEEHENRADLHERGGIQSPEFDAERSGGNREVRQNEEGIPEETSSDTVQQTPALGETVRTSLGDREDGAGENRADNERADSTEQREREDESGKSDTLGADDEQHESPSGRSDFDRADLQLSHTSGEQISLFDGIAFPTESEQIEYIDKAETASFSAFSLSQDDIDTVLRYGGNADDSRMRITAEFMKDKPTEAHAEYLKSLFRGGNGYRVNGRDISAWYAEDGIRIAFGRQAENVRYAQVILWTDAAERIDELLDAGEFATETELAEAVGNERRLAAQELVYLQRDIREDVRDKYFDKSWFEGIFSESCDRIADMLSDNAMRDIVTDAASRFAENYAKDKSMLLFHYHKPEETARKLRELSDMKRTFRGGLTEMPTAEEFITEDEINHVFFVRGSGVSGSRARIYEYFTAEHTAKEKQDFLKSEYGTGGHSHALSGSSGSSEWHDSKGIRLQKSGCHDVQISWQNAVNRIQNLIRSDRYFKPEVKNEPQDSVETPKNEPEPEVMPDKEPVPTQNYHITDDTLGEAGPKTKFRMNMEAIYTLKILENENRNATPEEQETLAKYVGWGGLAEAFDEDNSSWIREYKELKAALTDEEYAAARASTLNAHYTSPTVIKAIYEAVGNMGFKTGNILEPSMGVGNFFGLLPESMQNSRLYGVELDSITGRIARKLYPKADITVAGFETTDRRDFFDLAVGNVPFGNYKVNDQAYNKLNFSIHDYFFAKTLDQVRPGGIIAFITSRYTMDKQSNEVRKYIAERADLLGAIRLPNSAFKKNAGTEVVSDIIFLQKRDRPQVIAPDWIHLGQTEDGFAINSYFIDHPEMVLGRFSAEVTQYGKQDYTIEPITEIPFADQLHEAIQNICGTYREAELPDLGENEHIDKTIPADPNVKNYSYTVVDGDVYYRENSVMVQPSLNAAAKERVKGMVDLRNCVQKLINQQLDGATDEEIKQTQEQLNSLYDGFTAKYGLINDRANRQAFSDDSSYYLLCSLEILDEEQKLKRKADMFSKRTIGQNLIVTSVDTSAEALTLSIAEKARVDMEYMMNLTGKSASDIVSELRGVIFQDPVKKEWQTADEYLSDNVREKLRQAENAVVLDSSYSVNVEALRSAQPKDLDASEIEVRLGATWIDKGYVRQFMLELLDPPFYLRRKIGLEYSEFTAEWNISGKSVDSGNINTYYTYGTDRANAYKILEDTLNLRDVRIYDTVTDPDGKERRVLNSKETTLAGQKQQAIKDAFAEWIWKSPDRRHALVRKYNELFNSTRPREYSGEHISFSGMNPEITLREHQKNAVAHILYGGNTLLAHEVGAGKTFEMVAAAMESKRLGLCSKPLFAVPNHLTEQWASEFLRLYPSANILVASKKDFEPANRKKFCARIATGNYDAVIMGHSQFEKIPMSKERQERLLEEQIEEITEGIAELKESRAERFTIKEMERTRKNLQVKLEKLQAEGKKDNVVTFEELGVDRLYVDEAHSFKNAFIYTKMRNVAGLSTTDSQKSADMLMKCRYLDEITGNRGIVFATGTPVSNSMTEMFTMMRYLQRDTLDKKHLNHFDAWASTFGETTTAIELAPEGTGYRARTRFAKFFNLPELMNIFKEAADIKTSDQLNLPVPIANYHNIVAKPTEIQKAMVQELSERASKVHSGAVDPSVDNMLKITSDGRKLGLDQRIINPELPDEPESKINLCVDNIYSIWNNGKADRLTQLVFSDLSTPKEGVFSVYTDIRDKLISRGVPQEEIAFIHDADTEVKKKELFAKVRSGSVRVLIGSTAKMGAGTNCQDRLIALHDLDCPWRPGDLQQRAGRIIRQGNMNPEVHIYRYVTEATFDAYLWQTIENKQKFISQIMTSKSPVRACDDIDEATLSYAEVKALCAGDDRIREKMDLDIEVSKLKLLKANHQSQQFRMQDDIARHYPEKIENYKQVIAGLEKDNNTAVSSPHPTDGFCGMKVSGSFYTDKEKAGKAILDSCKSVTGAEPVTIGSYRGFSMAMSVEDFGRQFVLTLRGEMSHRVELGKDVRGNIVRIDNALGQIPARIQAAQAQLENVRNQLETAKAEVNKPFPKEDELKTKSARLSELNAELNIDERTPTCEKEKPSVLEKLKSTQTVSTVPKKVKDYER